MKIKEFVRLYGQPYSDGLGINLKQGRSKEIIKWFLASILYSKPIRESSASKTYRCFEKHSILSADTIVCAGWEKLVSILDEGGYTRYDYSTADKLLQVFGNLKRLYQGDLIRLYEISEDSKDLESRLNVLGKGIGDTTISVFLRDMRNIWRKADPQPTPLVKAAMKSLGITDLKSYAQKHHIDLIHLETALLRYSKDFLKKGKRLSISTS